MTADMLIVGAGYSGAAFARLARANGHRVAGTTRSPERAASLSAEGIEGIVFDGAPTDALLDALSRATHLVVAAGPGEAGDPTLDGLGERLEQGTPALRWVGYLSTVGVYGDHGGAWVDETSDCRPKSRRSLARLAVEDRWRAFKMRRGVPVAVLRLSGIYGPGRNALANLEKGTARRIVKPGQVFNRIHVDDIAGALALLSERGLGGEFNVTDDEPAPPQDVVAYAAALMGIEPLTEIAFAEADMTPMARSFYGENKRVSNAKLKAAGFRLRHPDYRRALDAMWNAGTWR